MTFIATPIIAGSIRGATVRYFISPAERLRSACCHDRRRYDDEDEGARGGERLAKERRRRGGKWCNASKGALKGDRVEKENERRERFYIYIYTPPGEFQSRWRGETS